MRWLLFSCSDFVATQCCSLLQSAEQNVVQVGPRASFNDATQRIVEHKPDRIVCISMPSKNERGETEFGVNIRAYLLAPLFIAQATAITANLGRVIPILCISVRTNEEALDDESSADVVKSVTDQLINMYSNMIK